jgi:phosphopantetheinyl transferase (holo-ACP synthase)
LHKALQVDSKAEEMDRENFELLYILTDIEYYTECARAYSEFLNSDKAKQLDTIREPIQGLDNVLVSLTVAVAAKEAYSKALMEKIPDFDFNALYGLINGLTGLVVESEKASVYKSALDKIEQVDFNVVTAISDNKSVLNSLTQWEVEKDFETSQLSKQETAITSKITEFNNFLKENNICPISGKPFKEGCVESIVAGVS